MTRIRRAPLLARYRGQLALLLCLCILALGWYILHSPATPSLSNNPTAPVRGSQGDIIVVYRDGHYFGEFRVTLVEDSGILVQPLIRQIRGVIPVGDPVLVKEGAIYHVGPVPIMVFLLTPYERSLLRNDEEYSVMLVNRGVEYGVIHAP